MQSQTTSNKYEKKANFRLLQNRKILIVKTMVIEMTYINMLTHFRDILINAVSLLVVITYLTSILL